MSMLVKQHETARTISPLSSENSYGKKKIRITVLRVVCMKGFNVSGTVENVAISERHTGKRLFEERHEESEGSWVGVGDCKGKRVLTDEKTSANTLRQKHGNLFMKLNIIWGYFLLFVFNYLPQAKCRCFALSIALLQNVKAIPVLNCFGPNDITGAMITT